MHFDDARSAETLKLLVEFSQSTQVILFTHERAVPTLAEDLIRDGWANLVELASAAARYLVAVTGDAPPSGGVLR